MTRVTLDTNVVPLEQSIVEAAAAYSFSISSVTERERPGSSAESSESVSITPETAVFGETRWGEGVWAGGNDPLEEILKVISSGSFPKPGKRETLTPAERNQLRDAMILAGHVRTGADILVTDDRRAFVKHGRREALEARFRTRIMTLTEFRAMVIPDGNQAI
jgi:hypothetical protein